VVQFPSERSGVGGFSSAMEDFLEFIHGQSLVDIPLQGGQFTWSNNQVWSKIDRFLLSPEWEEHYPDVSQSRLPRLLSDHFPLMLVCGSNRDRKKYFKFENMWLKSVGFVEQVQRWWESYDFQGLPSFVLASKLKALKVDLKIWNAKVFGDVGKKKKELLEGIKELECFEEARGLVEEKWVQKSDMIGELEKTLIFEEVNWRQKSRALWLKEGDNNAKFFHRVAKSHRRYNHVGVLRINGALSSDPVEIKDHIVNYYDSLYTEQNSWRPRVDGISFSSIDADECLWLERGFEEQEVWEVVREMNGDKAPGPDGFSMAFFQKCWGVLKKDIMAVFSEFHNSCQFERSLNATFVSLIPKKANAL
jgi:hypothetical protein